jgi:hypothetical protein
MTEILHFLAEASPGATWVAVFVTAVVTAFVFYIGVAMVATLRAKDPQQFKVRYRVFSDLLALFSRRRQR